MRAISPDITEKILIDDTLLITVEEVGRWLNLSHGAITMQTDLITSLIKSATEIVEKYLWLTLRPTTYLALYDLPADTFFGFIGGSVKLNLERSPILSINDVEKIEYLDSNDEFVEFDRGTKTIDGLFDNTTERIIQRKWASVYFRETIPFENRINAFKVRITFKSGFIPGDILTQLPETLKIGMLKMIASNYTNRGDCSNCGCDLNGSPVPCDAKSMIDMWSVANTVVGGAYNSSGFFCG